MSTQYSQARQSIQTLTKTNPNSDRKLSSRSRGAAEEDEARGPVKAGRSDPRTSTSRLRRNRGARGTLLGGARDGFTRAGSGLASTERHGPDRLARGGSANYGGSPPK